MTITLSNVISILGLLFGSGLLGVLWKQVQQQKRSTDAVKLGIQALLRAQMINDYNRYVEKGFAPIYARENFEKVWKQYEALGENGVMEDIRKKFFALPTKGDN